MASPMKANPGGQIATDSIIGRDELLKQLWATVEQQSVLLTAERRIGKTTLMKHMKNVPMPGWVPVYQDLERCRSAAQFAMAVYREVNEFLGKKKKAANKTMAFLKSLGGTEIAGIIKLPPSV